MKNISTISKATRGKFSSLILAYTAGFIDGEGSILITRVKNKKSGNYHYLMRASCVNTDKKSIYFLYDTFSGFRPYELAKKHRDNPKHRLTYQWLISGKNALEFIKLIRPFLKIKKEQAELAIHFQERKNKEGNRGKCLTSSQIKWRNEYWNKMSKLNLRERYSRRD